MHSAALLCSHHLLTTMCSIFIQYEIAVVTSEGVEIEGPLNLDTNWDVAHYVR